MTAEPKVDLAQVIADYKKTFSTPEGQAVLKDLARYVHIGLPITIESDEHMAYGVACMQRVFWYVYHKLHTEQRVTGKHVPPLDFDVFERTTPHLRSTG